MDAPRSALISQLAMDVQVVRRVAEIVREPAARPTREVSELHRAALERLRNMSALELVEALIDYRRVTGVPFKL